MKLLDRSAVEHQGFADAGVRRPPLRWLLAGWLVAPALGLAAAGVGCGASWFLLGDDGAEV